MRIEAVTVCVGYADFLEQTLKENLPLIDYLVVVTSPDDEATQRVCRQQSVPYVMSDEYKRNGTTHDDPAKVFNKGRLIRRGFDQLSGKDWILHLDADVVLPRKFRRLVEAAHLDPTCIYGADRQDVTGWDAWARLKEHVGAWDNHAHENQHWFHPSFRTASRWVSIDHGYVPIGFFQLFHGSALIQGGYHVRNYPMHHGNAARSDVQFGLQWDRRQRLVVPELIVLHLQSDDASMGANWNGRKTAAFAPGQSHSLIDPTLHKCPPGRQGPPGKPGPPGPQGPPGKCEHHHY